MYIKFSDRVYENFIKWQLQMKDYEYMLKCAGLSERTEYNVLGEEKIVYPSIRNKILDVYKNESRENLINMLSKETQFKKKRLDVNKMTKAQIAVYMELLFNDPQIENADICDKKHEKEMIDYSLSFTEKEFKNNPFIKTIKIPEVTNGKFSYGYAPIEAGRILKYNTFLYKDILTPCIGFAEDNIKIPVLMKKGHIKPEAAVNPHVISTMQEAVNKAKGNVLTAGCGMGYFAFMASEKEEVKSVKIIEENPEVIKLFENYILPQFPNKEKINIECVNPIYYFSSVLWLIDKKFDYCFIDLWKNDKELNLYAECKALGNKLRFTPIDYWIENELIWNAAKITSKFIEGSKLQKIGDAEGLYFYNEIEEKCPGILDILINETNDIEIKNMKDLKTFLSPDGTKEIMDRLLPKGNDYYINKYKNKIDDFSKILV